MNISFVKLDHEECELCEHFKQHPHTLENPDVNCTVCTNWTAHFSRQSATRNVYCQDKTGDPIADEIVFSVDLQKMIMLQRLKIFKSVIFIQRLLVYNQTFAPICSKMNQKSSL